MYQLDVSHVMLHNYTLLIYIHIPCHSQLHKLYLYEYRQLPMLLPTSPQPLYIVPEIDNKYLAISTSELEFQTFSDDHLATCKVLNSQYYCPGSAVLHRNPSTSCLYAVFKQNYNHIRAACIWRVANSTSITPLNDTHFVLFSPPPTVSYIRLKCPSAAIQTLPISQVLSVINLAPGCRALSDSLVFTAPLKLPDFRPELSSGALSFNPLITDLLSTTTPNASLQQLALTLPRLKTPFSLLDSSVFTPPSFFHTFSVPLLIGSLIFLFLTLYVSRLCFLTECPQHAQWCLVSPARPAPHPALNTDASSIYATPFSGSAPSGAPAPLSSPPTFRGYPGTLRAYPSLDPIRDTPDHYPPVPPARNAAFL